MPRIRLDLQPETYEALAARAIQERRSIDWQAEVLIESGLGLRDEQNAGPWRSEGSKSAPARNQDRERDRA